MEKISNTEKIEELLKELPPGSRAKMRFVLERLFRLPRTGWVDRKISDPETVGEHTYDIYRLAQSLFEGLAAMIVVHDAAESDPAVGDIRTDHMCPLQKRWTLEEKHIAETRAMIEICADLGQDGIEIFELFYEYEQQKTKRARLVKQLDKLQVIMKATEYELQGEKVKAEEFSAELIKDSCLLEILGKTRARISKAPV